MASFKADRNEQSEPNVELAEFLRQDLIELSHLIKAFSAVVQQKDDALRAKPGGKALNAGYATLAASLERLSRSFETLHRYGDLGLTTAQADDGRPKPLPS